jgi:hypothetical protein
MSTKIYNAYIYHGTIDELFLDLKKIRKQYHKKFAKEFAKNCFICADLPPMYFDRFCEVEFYSSDKRQVGRKRVADLPAYKLVTFLDFFIQSKVNHPLNIEASCVVYPYAGNLYVQFFGYSPRLSKKFKDFHYQNQTDWPEGMTEKEWCQRERVWEVIFKNTDTPSSAGLVYEFHSDLFELCAEIEVKKC